MTRARDRLYITGFHNGSLPQGSWYETIQNALAPGLEEALDFQGRTVWRTGPALPFKAPAASAGRERGLGLPAWLSMPAPQEHGLAHLPASGLVQMAGPGPALGHAPEPDRRTAQSRGILIHRLLEILPALPAPHRQRGARLIASAYSVELAPKQREEAIEIVLKLLSGAAPMLPGERLLPEAGLALSVKGRESGRAITILGQADRIHLSSSEAFVLDYKSGALPADHGLSQSHLAQLACYRLALRRIYPQANIRAAVLNTASGTIIEAAAADLDAVLDEVLDAPIVCEGS